MHGSAEPTRHRNATRRVERDVEQTLSHLRTLDAPVQRTQPSGPLTLEDLYRQHRMRLVRLAILLVDEPATAEDVVQEAFTGLHPHEDRQLGPHEARRGLLTVQAGRPTA